MVKRHSESARADSTWLGAYVLREVKEVSKQQTILSSLTPVKGHDFYAWNREQFLRQVPARDERFDFLAMAIRGQEGHAHSFGLEEFDK